MIRNISNFLLFIVCLVVLTTKQTFAEYYVLTVSMAQKGQESREATCRVSKNICYLYFSIPYPKVCVKSGLMMDFTKDGQYLKGVFHCGGRPLSTKASIPSLFHEETSTLLDNDLPLDLYLMNSSFENDNPNFAVTRPPGLHVAALALRLERSEQHRP